MRAHGGAERHPAHQQPDGLILWFEGGHADVWNHVESAMALDVAGRHDEAERAYRWAAANQHADGWWHHYYVAGGVEDAFLTRAARAAAGSMRPG